MQRSLIFRIIESHSSRFFLPALSKSTMKWTLKRYRLKKQNLPQGQKHSKNSSRLYALIREEKGYPLVKMWSSGILTHSITYMDLLIAQVLVLEHSKLSWKNNSLKRSSLNYSRIEPTKNKEIKSVYLLPLKFIIAKRNAICRIALRIYF